MRKPGSEPVYVQEGRPCRPHCKNTRTRRNGKWDRMYRDPAQRYKCMRCGRRFPDDAGFAGRHYPPHAILFALLALSMGMNGPQISLMMRQDRGPGIGPSTIEMGPALLRTG